MHCAGLWSDSYCNWPWNCERKQYCDQMFLTSFLTPPPFFLPVWQAAEGCCAASALYVSVIRLTRPRLSVFAREWIVHPWWRLFAARIHPPTPMNASLRKPSATPSDASRCCARDHAVSNITCLPNNQPATLRHWQKTTLTTHSISFWTRKWFFFKQMENIS